MIKVNVDKAKEIAHDLRRAIREMEFKPLDEVISKQIPGKFEQAESKRAIIRDKYATFQTAIESVQNAEELTTIVQEMRDKFTEHS